jgi:hypothetical protein
MLTCIPPTTPLAHFTRPELDLVQIVGTNEALRDIGYYLLVPGAWLSSVRLGPGWFSTHFIQIKLIAHHHHWPWRWERERYPLVVGCDGGCVPDSPKAGQASDGVSQFDIGRSGQKCCMIVSTQRTFFNSA